MATQANAYRLRFLIALLMLAALAGQAFAEDDSAKSPFEGGWVIETHLGPRPLEGTFRVVGAEVTGTLRLGTGDVVPISAGKATDKTISFHFHGETGRDLVFSGTLNGDNIDFILSMPPNDDGPAYTGKRKK
ncbi:MAG: hypothetical protein ABI823_09640 [Bryobacteraceae bacterium]